MYVEAGWAWNTTSAVQPTKRLLNCRSQLLPLARCLTGTPTYWSQKWLPRPILGNIICFLPFSETLIFWWFFTAQWIRWSCAGVVAICCDKSSSSWSSLAPMKVSFIFEKRDVTATHVYLIERSWLVEVSKMYKYTLVKMLWIDSSYFYMY